MNRNADRFLEKLKKNKALRNKIIAMYKNGDAEGIETIAAKAACPLTIKDLGLAYNHRVHELKDLELERIAGGKPHGK